MISHRRLIFVALAFIAGAAQGVTWSKPLADLVKQYAGADGSAPVAPPTRLHGYKAVWSIDSKKSIIVVGVEATTTGWVGFGLSEAAAMRGADIMMGHVNPTTGKAAVGDYHSSANGKPVRDGCQDWSVHHGEEKDGSTLIIASRKLTTNDSNDRPILLSGLTKTGLIFAYGAGDDHASYTYHSSNRAKVYVNLGSGGDAGQAAWSAAKKANADLSSIELKANEGSVPTGTPAQTFRGPEPGGQQLPTSRTACK